MEMHTCLASGVHYMAMVSWAVEFAKREDRGLKRTTTLVTEDEMQMLARSRLGFLLGNRNVLLDRRAEGYTSARPYVRLFRRFDRAPAQPPVRTIVRAAVRPFN